MANTIISTVKAPAAIGPYSQAIQTEDMLFTSGQLGLDPQTGSLPEGIQAQTSQALANVNAILKEAGFTKENVVKTTVFLKDMTDFGAVNEIYADFFGDHKPARTCVEVTRLPKNGLVEIEIVAAR